MPITIQCAWRDCTREALRDSNYCLLHQPGRDPLIGKMFTHRSSSTSKWFQRGPAAGKKSFKKAYKKAKVMKKAAAKRKSTSKAGKAKRSTRKK